MAAGPLQPLAHNVQDLEQGRRGLVRLRLRATGAANAIGEARDMTNTPGDSPATVYLVGAGPGDPGLITLRAVQCLSRADVILYDYLVNYALLEHASPSAELVGLGHHASGRNLTPDEIVARVLEEARVPVGGDLHVEPVPREVLPPGRHAASPPSRAVPPRAASPAASRRRRRRRSRR